MRVVFMGTPAIAEVSLVELLERGVEVVGVYARPDKPVGRKQIITPPPVKVRALENGIPVFQPTTLRAPGAAQELAVLAPDLVVVVAYGLLLPPDVLAVPTHGCVNLHVSLLPKYRGAAPIQWAVINGDAETGVTVMQLDEGLDSGPVLARQAIEIGPNATSGEMFELSGVIGARLLADTVDAIARGEANPVPQQGEPTLAPMLKKDMARIDFARPARELHNLVRGCNPWPLAWFDAGDKRVKVEKTVLSSLAGGKPGEILSTSPLTVACGQGALELLQVVPQGARAMTGTEWAAGRRFKAGDSILQIVR